MIATRLSSVWQVAGVAAAALVCYLMSQSVAAERASLAKVDRQIAQAHDQIDQLTTEITARSRPMTQEAWNQVFGLRAARPAQFVASGVQLASLHGRPDGKPALALDPAIAPQQGPVTHVAYQQAAPAHALPPAPRPAPPSVVASEPAQPLLRAATFVRPKPDRLAGDAPAPVARAAYKPAPTLLPADIGSLAAAEAADRKDKRAKAGQ